MQGLLSIFVAEARLRSGSQEKSASVELSGPSRSHERRPRRASWPVWRSPCGKKGLHAFIQAKLGGVAQRREDSLDHLLRRAPARQKSARGLRIAAADGKGQQARALPLV